MNKRLAILETALEEMRREHTAIWDSNGSELCVGEMLRKEQDLIDKIDKLKLESRGSHIEDPKQIIDN